MEYLDFQVPLDKLINMWGKIMFRTLTIFIVLLMVELAGAEEKKPAESPKFPEHCRVDSDCVAAPAVNPRCSHYCSNDCQDDTPVCPVYYKFSGISVADCIQNAACKAPNKIRCKDKACIAE